MTVPAVRRNRPASAAPPYAPRGRDARLEEEVAQPSTTWDAAGRRTVTDQSASPKCLTRLLRGTDDAPLNTHAETLAGYAGARYPNRTGDIQLGNDGNPITAVNSHSQPSENKRIASEVGFQPTQALAANRKNFAAGLLLEKSGSETAEWLLSVRDVATALAVSTATVYGLCESGKLPHVRVLNVIRVRREDLQGFIAAGVRIGRPGQPAR